MADVVSPSNTAAYGAVFLLPTRPRVDAVAHSGGMHANGLRRRAPTHARAARNEQEPEARRRTPSRDMASRVPHAGKLERFLLRRSVGALEADRSRCIDCGRTPLTGEQVHLYDGRRRGVVCALCRPLRREQPVASELVRHCEHGHTVRRTSERPTAEERWPRAPGAEPRAHLAAR